MQHQKDLEGLYENFTDDFIDIIHEGHFAVLKEAMGRGCDQRRDERTPLHCARAIPHTMAYDKEGRMLYMDFWFAGKLVTTKDVESLSKRVQDGQDFPADDAFASVCQWFFE